MVAGLHDALGRDRARPSRPTSPPAIVLGAAAVLSAAATLGAVTVLRDAGRSGDAEAVATIVRQVSMPQPASAQAAPLAAPPAPASDPAAVAAPNRPPRSDPAMTDAAETLMIDGHPADVQVQNGVRIVRLRNVPPRAPLDPALDPRVAKLR